MCRISSQTLQAGKYFPITLTFPSNFEVLPGQPVIFSARTSNPQFEVVKVPISQIPPRAQVARPPRCRRPGRQFKAAVSTTRGGRATSRWILVRRPIGRSQGVGCSALFP